MLLDVIVSLAGCGSCTGKKVENMHTRQLTGSAAPGMPLTEFDSIRIKEESEIRECRDWMLKPVRIKRPGSGFKGATEMN